MMLAVSPVMTTLATSLALTIAQALASNNNFLPAVTPAQPRRETLFAAPASGPRTAENREKAELLASQIDGEMGVHQENIKH